MAGAPAEAERLERAGLPEDERAFYARWDGLRIGNDDVVVYPLDAVGAATTRAQEEGILRPGDKVIGEQGRDLWVVPDDPWEEGATIVAVEETGERWPEGTSLARLVLAHLAMSAVLYDDDGEFRDGVVGERGELEPSVERKLLRRHLDFDPDAPAPRFRLARSLYEAGEVRAARIELEQVIERAPRFAWAHRLRGEVLERLGDPRGACEAFETGAAYMADEDVAVATLACAAAAAQAAGDEARRADLAGRILSVRPDYAAHLASSAREQLERGHRAAATRLAVLGRAVAPRNLELLELHRSLAGERGDEGTPPSSAASR